MKHYGTKTMGWALLAHLLLASGAGAHPSSLAVPPELKTPADVFREALQGTRGELADAADALDEGDVETALAALSAVGRDSASWTRFRRTLSPADRVIFDDLLARLEAVTGRRDDASGVSLRPRIEAADQLLAGLLFLTMPPVSRPSPLLRTGSEAKEAPGPPDTEAP